MNNTYYRLFTHLDAPKRYLSLTIDELMVTAISFSSLALLNHKVLSILIGFGLLSALRLLKRGQSPRRLLVLMYWYLPFAITQFLLPKLPASHHRIYLA